MTVKNWDKYQERPDRANYVWFKFHNDFFQDDSIFDLGNAERIIFIFLMCECSRQNKQTISINLGKISSILGFSVKEEHLMSLDCAGLCSYEPGHFQESDGLLEKRREDIYRPDLDKIYQEYPKRQNQRKKDGIRSLERQIKTVGDYDRLLKATKNYAVYAKGMEPRYIKQFATFSNQWEEWVDSAPTRRFAPVQEI